MLQVHPVQATRRGPGKPDAHNAAAAPGPAPERVMDAGQPSTRDRIWSAILELASVGRAFTRSRLSGMTGLKFSIVDDHMERFIEDDMVVRINPGVFELVQQYPADMPISCTPLDDGRVKLERGDSVWTLNPSEARRLAKLMAGWASELAQLETQADMVGLMNRIDARTRRTEKRMDNAARTIAQMRRRGDRQLSLL